MSALGLMSYVMIRLEASSGEIVDTALSGEGIIWVLPSWALGAGFTIVLMLGVAVLVAVLRVQMGRAVAAREAAARWRPDPTPAHWEPVRFDEPQTVLGLIPGESSTRPALESRRAMAELPGARRRERESRQPAQLESAALPALPPADRDRVR